MMEHRGVRIRFRKTAWSRTGETGSGRLHGGKQERHDRLTSRRRIRETGPECGEEQEMEDQRGSREESRRSRKD